MRTRRSGAGSPRPRSPLEEVQAVERPEPHDDLADDAVVGLRAEAARVRRGFTVVAHREEVAVRDAQRVADLWALRDRGAVRADEVARLAVHVQPTRAEIHGVAGHGDDALHGG